MALASTPQDQLLTPEVPILNLKNPIKIKRVSSETTLTVSETQGNAAEYQGEVFRSRTDEDLDEGRVRLDEARVHRHPRQTHNSLYKRDMGAVEARNDMHECL